MKVVLFLGLLLSSIVLQSGSTTTEPDIVVVKFRCGLFERRSSMISSVHDPDATMNEPIRITQVNRNEPQEVKNRQDMQQRRADMRTSEINAALSAQADSKFYFYRIQVQNMGSKLVKSFAWRYQAGEVPNPFDRQFFCVVNAKPSEKKEFELFSPLAPTRVVDASKPADKTNADQKTSIVINKIEYDDGSVWKRPGWNPMTFLPEDTKKVGAGKCIGI